MVLISLGVLLRDALVAAAGVFTGIVGTALIVVLAGAAIRGLSGL